MSEPPGPKLNDFKNFSITARVTSSLHLFYIIMKHIDKNETTFHGYQKNVFEIITFEIPIRKTAIW